MTGPATGGAETGSRGWGHGHYRRRTDGGRSERREIRNPREGEGRRRPGVPRDVRRPPVDPEDRRPHGGCRRVGGRARRLPRGVHPRLSQGPRLRGGRRDAVAGGAGRVPPVFRSGRRGARRGDRGHRRGGEGQCRPPRRRRGRAGGRDAVLHGDHHRPRRHAPGQAPQADAHGDGAGHLGQRRRVHPPGSCLPASGRSGR